MDCLFLALRTTLSSSVLLALALAVHCLSLALRTTLCSALSLANDSLITYFLLTFACFTTNIYAQLVHTDLLQCSIAEHCGQTFVKGIIAYHEEVLLPKKYTRCTCIVQCHVVYSTHAHNSPMKFQTASFPTNEEVQKCIIPEYGYGSISVAALLCSSLTAHAAANR